MKQFTKILHTPDRGQVAVILFESVKMDDAIIEFTFHDDDIGRMIRHDMKFGSRSEAITFFHDLDDNNFLLVDKKVIRKIKTRVKAEEAEEQRQEQEGKTIQ